jgi:glycosyltransferase involved in cell wall biosynthesis
VKIGIDARWIFPEISGIGAYTRELIRCLSTEDRHNAYLIFFDDPAVRDRTMVETGMGDAVNFTPHMLPYGVFSPWNQLCFPRRLASLRIDVFHSTNYMIPFLAFPRSGKGATRCVVTVHDVIPLIFPRHAPRSKKSRLFPLYRRLMIELGIRAHAIITDSRASATDIVKHLEIPPAKAGKVHAVYCGVGQHYRPGRPQSREAGEARTLLYVGRADPYKNLACVIKAFVQARSQVAFPLKLTVAGSPDRRYPEAEQLAKDFGLSDGINWTGYLSDEDLRRLYRQSDLLVHPSRYEGFGLQILEAMASGLPVLCSNGGSLPEVAGDAALMFEPDDVDGFAKGICTVLGDPELAAGLADKGLRQAAKFTWQKAARETLGVYEAVGGDTA